jgi:hypothetical protein
MRLLERSISSFVGPLSRNDAMTASIAASSLSSETPFAGVP